MRRADLSHLKKLVQMSPGGEKRLSQALQTMRDSIDVSFLLLQQHDAPDLQRFSQYDYNQK